MPPMKKPTQAKKRAHDDVEETELVVRQTTKRGEAAQSRQAARHEEQSPAAQSSPPNTSNVKVVVKKQAKPKMNFPVKFAQRVKEDQEALRNGLQDFDNDIAEKHKTFNTAFIAQISAALTLPPQVPSMDSSGGADAAKVKQANPHSPLWDASVMIARRGQGLQKLYQQACEAVKQATPVSDLGSGWKDDCIQLEKEVDMGYRVAERQIARVFDLHKSGIVDVKDEVALREQERASKVLSMAVPQAAVGITGPLTLTDTLRYAESGLKRLAKGLPVDEGSVAQDE